jgi:hypothetical protein
MRGERNRRADIAAASQLCEDLQRLGVVSGFGLRGHHSPLGKIGGVTARAENWAR